MGATNTRTLDVALVQYDISWEDKVANHARIEARLLAADVPSGALVLIPELGDTGFSNELDKICNDGGLSIAWAKRMAEDHGWILQIGHAEQAPDGRGRNCATLIFPDGRIGSYQKMHLISLLGEDRVYDPGNHILIADMPGDLKISPLICYDLRFPELFRLAQRHGANVLAVSACWPVARIDAWRQLLIARAIENQSWVLGCNRVGDDPNLSYGGTSMIIGPDGVVLAEADQTEEIVLKATLDIESGTRFCNRFPFTSEKRVELLGSTDVIRI